MSKQNVKENRSNTFTLQNFIQNAIGQNLTKQGLISLINALADSDERMIKASIDVLSNVFKKEQSEKIKTVTSNNCFILDEIKLTENLKNLLKLHLNLKTDFSVDISNKILNFFLNSYRLPATQVSYDYITRSVNLLSKHITYLINESLQNENARAIRAFLLLKMIYIHCPKEMCSKIKRLILNSGIFLRYLYISLFDANNFLDGKQTHYNFSHPSPTVQDCCVDFLNIVFINFSDGKTILNNILPPFLIKKEILKFSTLEKIVSYKNQDSFNIKTYSSLFVQFKTNSSMKLFENWSRVLLLAKNGEFDTATLIWNSQTKKELQTAIENELNMLRIKKKIQNNATWDWEGFFVKYKSLDNLMQCSNYYVRNFLKEITEEQNDENNYLDSEEKCALLLYNFINFAKTLQNNEQIEICFQVIFQIYKRSEDKKIDEMNYRYLFLLVNEQKTPKLTKLVIDLILYLTETRRNGQIFLKSGGILFLQNLIADFVIEDAKCFTRESFAGYDQSEELKKWELKKYVFLKSLKIYSTIAKKIKILHKNIVRFDFLNFLISAISINDEEAKNDAIKLTFEIAKENTMNLPLLAATGFFVFLVDFFFSSCSDQVVSLINWFHKFQSKDQKLMVGDSALNLMLPSSLIKILENEGTKKFTYFFSTENQTSPELLWNDKIKNSISSDLKSWIEKYKNALAESNSFEEAKYALSKAAIPINFASLDDFRVVEGIYVKLYAQLQDNYPIKHPEKFLRGLISDFSECGIEDKIDNITAQTKIVLTNSFIDSVRKYPAFEDLANCFENCLETAVKNIDDNVSNSENSLISQVSEDLNDFYNHNELNDFDELKMKIMIQKILSLLNTLLSQNDNANNSKEFAHSGFVDLMWRLIKEIFEMRDFFDSFKENGHFIVSALDCLFSFYSANRNEIANLNEEKILFLFNQIDHQNAAKFPTLTYSTLRILEILTENHKIFMNLIKKGFFVSLLRLILLFDNSIDENIPKITKNCLLKPLERKENEKFLNEIMQILPPGINLNDSDFTEILTDAKHSPYVKWNYEMKEELILFLESQTEICFSVENFDSKKKPEISIWPIETNFEKSNDSPKIFSRLNAEYQIENVFLKHFVEFKNEPGFLEDPKFVKNVIPFFNALCEKVEFLEVNSDEFDTILFVFDKLCSEFDFHDCFSSINKLLTKINIQKTNEETLKTLKIMNSLSRMRYVSKFILNNSIVLSCIYTDLVLNNEEYENINLALNLLFLFNKIETTTLLENGLLLPLLYSTLNSRKTDLKCQKYSNKTKEILVKTWKNSPPILAETFGKLLPQKIVDFFLDFDIEKEYSPYSIDEDFFEEEIIWNDQTRLDLKKFLSKECEKLLRNLKEETFYETPYKFYRTISKRFLSTFKVLDTHLCVGGIFLEPFIKNFGQFDFEIEFIEELLNGIDSESKFYDHILSLKSNENREKTLTKLNQKLSHALQNLKQIWIAIKIALESKPEIAQFIDIKTIIFRLEWASENIEDDIENEKINKVEKIQIINQIEDVLKICAKIFKFNLKNLKKEIFVDFFFFVKKILRKNLTQIDFCSAILDVLLTILQSNNGENSENFPNLNLLFLQQTDLHFFEIFGETKNTAIKQKIAKFFSYLAQDDEINRKFSLWKENFGQNKIADFEFVIAEIASDWSVAKMFLEDVYC